MIVLKQHARQDSHTDLCVWFIDCTKIRMCRPGDYNLYQKAMKSGHKQVHCLIYQTITTHYSSIFSLIGRMKSWRHGITILRQSVWNGILCEHLFTYVYYIYGDQAYLILSLCEDRLLEAFSVPRKWPATQEWVNSEAALSRTART